MVEPKRFEVNFVFEEGKKIIVMLGGLDGNPLPNLSYEVIIGDDTHQGTTSSEGLATESIKDENIDKITIKYKIMSHIPSFTIFKFKFNIFIISCYIYSFFRFDMRFKR